MTDNQPKREIVPGGGYKYARRPKPDGYKGHKKGSRKEIVHQLYDEQGEEVAKAKAIELGIKPVSAHLWVLGWRRDARKGIQ